MLVNGPVRRLIHRAVSQLPMVLRVVVFPVVVKVVVVVGMVMMVMANVRLPSPPPPPSPHLFVTRANIDQLDSDVPGPPISSEEFKEAARMDHQQYDPTTSRQDPIEIAGQFQGDIYIQSPQEYKELVNSDPRTRNAIRDTSKLWDKGVMPYVISSAYSKVERGTIAAAMAMYHNNTCLRFVPHTTEQDYIHIIKSDGCASSVGRRGGGQILSLAGGCMYVGVIMHEFMHAAGFYHEQSRPDRDNYIIINDKNIQKGSEDGFSKISWDKMQTLGIDYDLGSVMHYGPYAFAEDRTKPTIVPKLLGFEMGQRLGFSPKDIEKLVLLYNCFNNTTTPVTESSTSFTATGETCKDYSKYCETWAVLEECTKNPEWMKVYCKQSCKQYGKGCLDKNEHCGFWTGKGECTKNPVYMNAYCPKSCGACRNVADPTVAPCVDQERHCQAWAKTGQCRSNPDYMLARCTKSCAAC